MVRISQDVAALAAAALLASSAAAQTVPLRGHFDGVLIDRTLISVAPPTFLTHVEGRGLATLQGRAATTATYEFIPWFVLPGWQPGMPIGTATGTATSTGQDGARIDYDLAVAYVSFSAYTGTLTVVGGTGRFEGATGGGAVSGTLTPDLLHQVEHPTLTLDMDGVLTFRH
jgi:hypothetical protein